MKRICLTVLLAATLFAADSKKPTPGPIADSDAKPVAPAKTEDPVPPGAVKTGDNTWKKTDEKGQVWIYRKTPFGLMKSLEGGSDPVATDTPRPASGNPFKGDPADRKEARSTSTPFSGNNSKSPAAAKKAKD